MPACQHCGNYESSKWDLAGYVCSECRPTCPSCDHDKFSSKFVLHDGEPFAWCNGCGQLLPPEFAHMRTGKETPAPDEPEGYDDVAGLTWRDADGAEPDPESNTPDVPTYYKRELEDMGGVRTEHLRR